MHVASHDYISYCRVLSGAAVQNYVLNRGVRIHDSQKIKLELRLKSFPVQSTVYCVRHFVVLSEFLLRMLVSCWAQIMLKITNQE